MSILAIALAALAGAPSPCNADPFRLDSDEFPIGMFSVDGAGGMAQVAKMGVGFVHTYANGRSGEAEGIKQDLAYLDAAKEHGLRVMFNLNGRKWVAADNGLDNMLKLVHAVKDHPALGFWYLYDEADGTHTLAEVKRFYDALKEATPGIPIAVATAWSKKWYTYNDALDLLMIDNYPVQHRPFPESNLSTMTKFTDSALKLGPPIMPINQCFNWKGIAGDRETYRNSPTKELRYPTKEEIRYWCYSGAAQGVRGMFWWSYYRSIQTGYGWINNDFAQVCREFRDFTESAAPAHTPEAFPRARDANVIMALWRRPKASYLVVVNAWPLEQTISRWMEDKVDSATLKPWGTTRDTGATLEGGKLTIGTAKPWEVFVWEVQEG